MERDENETAEPTAALAGQVIVTAFAGSGSELVRESCPKSLWRAGPGSLLIDDRQMRSWMQVRKIVAEHYDDRGRLRVRRTLLYGPDGALCEAYERRQEGVPDTPGEVFEVFVERLRWVAAGLATNKTASQSA